MKRFGYHSLLLQDGTEVKGPLVVEFDEGGRLIAWHTLLVEEPYVEWRGGMYKEKIKY